MLVDLHAAVQDALTDDSNVIVVRSAAPGVFCAGFDINYLGTPAEEAGENLLHECSALIENGRKVTVAVADGLVVGGGLELFMSCDLRIATPCTTLRMPPVQLARVYYLGGVARFVRLLGLTVATELMLTGRLYPADEALRTGALTRLVSDLATAQAYWKQVADLPAKAQQAAKAMLRVLGNDLLHAEVAPDNAAQKLIDAALASEDAREAINAFHGKRKPNFTGR
jgi:enoyl-CoA hydratase/carnithine racemase